MGAPGEPRLEVEWTGARAQFREALAVLRTALPVLPPQVALRAFDVDVLARGWPGRALALSLALHVLFVVVPLPEFLIRPPAPQTALNRIRIEYDLRWAGGSRLLPPISPAARPKPKTGPGARREPPPRETEPVKEQTIVSNPPQPNHPTQTLLTQFGLERARLRPRDLHLPNMVIPPPPAPTRSKDLELRRLRAARSPLDFAGHSPRPAPPRPPTASELALAETRLENLYPKLAVAPGSRSGTAAPAPELGGTPGAPGGAPTAPGIIALSADPAVPRPVLELPEENLRARFAIGPQNGSGGPDGVAGGAPEVGVAAGGDPGGEAGVTVPNLFVSSAGPTPTGPVIAGPAGGGNELGSGPATAGAQGRAAPAAGTPPDKSVRERAEKILEGLGPGTRPGSGGGRRVYTVLVNMPNLSSQTGSWVLRFAELGDEGRGGGGASDSPALEAPVAVKKVDPRYPAAARRQGVEGVVFLYGVIRPDGSVDQIRVVRSVHELLDQNAVAAFQRWRFQPGRKNGVAVALEVVVEIPFRLNKLF